LLPFSIRYVIAVDMNDEDCVNLAKNHDVMGAESWKWFAANKTCAPTNSTGHAIFGGPAEVPESSDLKHVCEPLLQNNRAQPGGLRTRAAYQMIAVDADAKAGSESCHGGTFDSCNDYCYKEYCFEDSMTTRGNPMGPGGYIAILCASCTSSCRSGCPANIGGCHQGYCWAQCWGFLGTFSNSEWCWTTQSYSQSYQYVTCTKDSECSLSWSCAGACTL